MATNLPSCFSIEFLEHLLKFLVNFTLLKYVKCRRSYGFLITKELIIGFQILDLKDHFSASLTGWLQNYGSLALVCGWLSLLNKRIWMNVKDYLCENHRLLSVIILQPFSEKYKFLYLRNQHLLKAF